jgi:hypothetical protein
MCRSSQLWAGPNREADGMPFNFSRSDGNFALSAYPTKPGTLMPARMLNNQRGVTGRPSVKGRQADFHVLSFVSTVVSSDRTPSSTSSKSRT